MSDVDVYCKSAVTASYLKTLPANSAKWPNGMDSARATCSKMPNSRGLIK